MHIVIKYIIDVEPMKMLFMSCFFILQLVAGVFSINPQENEALPWHYDISERVQVPILQSKELIDFNNDAKNAAMKDVAVTNQESNVHNFRPTNLPFYEKLMNEIKKNNQDREYFYKPIWLKDVNYPYFNAPSNNVIRSKTKSASEKAINFSSNRMGSVKENLSDENIKKPIIFSPLKVIQIPLKAENVKVQSNNLSKIDKSLYKAPAHFQNDDLDQSQMDIYDVNGASRFNINGNVKRSVMDDPFSKMQVRNNYNSKTDEFRDEMFAPILTEIFPMMNPFENLNNMQLNVIDKNAYKRNYDQILKTPFQTNEKPFDDDVNYNLHISNKDEKLPREIRYPLSHIHQLSSKTSTVPKIKSGIKLKEKLSQNKNLTKKIDNRQDDFTNFNGEVDRENVKSKNAFYNFLQNYSNNIFKTTLEYENKIKAKI